MTSFTTLQTSLIARRGYRVVDAEALDKLAADLPLSMLFFAGDGARVAESDDGAVILAELDDALDHVVTVLVVDRASERPLQRRYHFNAFPALVFLKEGGYIGCIERVLDWADYLREIPEILARTPHEPPPFRLPGALPTLRSTTPAAPDSSHGEAVL